MRVGARPITSETTEFRLWAPDAEQVAVVINGEPHIMAADTDGYFVSQCTAPANTRYRYLINNTVSVPDPASRAQSDNVHGESIVTDPTFTWRHEQWRGRPWPETVIYELHPGTYGGFAGITHHLPRLAALGVTAIELMPIADFPGQHNWGYDGVLIYAPDRAYGTPADLKTMIDTAHGLGLQVFLDVVYNHFGPDGNYLGVYAKSFFRDDLHTPWGRAIDFRRRQVRDFFIGNALYWLLEFRFDGLRFDAVHAIAEQDFLHELAASMRAAAETGRHIHLILENENNDPTLLRERPGGAGFDAQWCDDWHHCVHVLLTGESEGYYGDFPNPAAQLARCLESGFAYQGEPSAHADGASRGGPSGHLPTTSFVICLQNHDQIGNRALGERLINLAPKRALRAAMALLLLTPQIPMMFMGEEWGETRPFLFFTDHGEELGELVRAGRRREFAQFAGFADAESREKIPDPNARETFSASIPIPAESEWTEFCSNLLSLRQRFIVPGLAGASSMGGETLSPTAIRAAWRLRDGTILTLATNFGAQPVPCPPGDATIAFISDGAFGADETLPAQSTVLWLAKA
ncbi:MAG: malto-oligosyltrehalose trehalohydrolase [Acidocella sp.]|nr:malto-oligosyltrehalose trehalohydrolase [Acidocella sp.]